jgi:two-component system, OmpR family, copper resistance phosphate regulon response regulator CusR
MTFQQEPVSDADKRNLLIVDDNEDITTVLKLGLERRGMVVTTFNDPLQALEEVKKRHFDLVITDISMPKMSGIELYREIRKHDGPSPVCFLSSLELEDTEFLQMFPDAPADIFLKKPIGLAELVIKIDELIQNGHDKSKLD